MAGFGDSVLQNSQAILQKVDKRCYTIAWQVFTDIIRGTPIDKGILINNWFPSTSGFSSETTSTLSTSGSDSLSRVNRLANSHTFLGKDGLLTLTNNIPYAYRAEVLGWPQPEWSGRVGPYRMVALALQAAAARNR